MLSMDQGGSQMKIVGIVTFITFSIWLSIGCGGYDAAGSIECQMLSPKASSPQSVLQKNEAKTQQYESEFKRNPDTTGRLPFSLIKDVLEVVAKPHKHFFNVTMTQASWKKATNILI
jgi:hypothetical protein